MICFGGVLSNSILIPYFSLAPVSSMRGILGVKMWADVDAEDWDTVRAGNVIAASGE